MISRMLLLGILVVACSDPASYSSCDDGTQPATGGCESVLATITIDGDARDWDAVPDPVTRCRDCPAGFVRRLHAARTTDGRVALLLEIEGAPLEDALHAYIVSFYHRTGPSLLEIRVQHGAAAELELNFAPIRGLPSEQAFGTSIEIAIPIDALQFGGGVDIFGGLEERSPIGWDRVQTERRYVAACWEPSSPRCQPT